AAGAYSDLLVNAYSEFGVEKPAREMEHNPLPVSDNPRRTGSIVVEFVVDTTGGIMPGTIMVVSATDSSFSRSLLRVLPRWRFYPAVVCGKAVRQWVRLPVEFR